MVSKVDLKVVVLGKEFVGKTALVERFLNDNFVASNSYQPTIGAAYGARKLINSNNIPVVMGVWDTAGSERYQSMTKMYYRGAKAAILCFDLCDSISFRKLDFWIKELKSIEPDCRIFLCGCKKDLVTVANNSRAVSVHMINELSRELNAEYFETSSKTAEGINELFQAICNDVSTCPGFQSQTLKNEINLERKSKTDSFSQCSKC